MKNGKTIAAQTIQGRLFWIEDNGGEYCDIYFRGRCIDAINTWDYERDERKLSPTEIRQAFFSWCENASEHIKALNL